MRLHAAQYATLLTPYRATALMIAPYGLNYISNKINSITYFSIKSIESDPIGYVKIRKSVTYGTEPVRLHAAQYATLLTPYRATALMIAPYGLAAKNIYFPLEFKGG